LVGRPDGKRPPIRTRHRWEDNIKTDFQEVGSKRMDWIGLVQDMNTWWAVVNAVTFGVT
jgi:hypothetical protein